MPGKTRIILLIRFQSGYNALNNSVAEEFYQLLWLLA